MMYVLCNKWIDEVHGTRCERIHDHDGPCRGKRPEVAEVRGLDFTFISMDEFPAGYRDVLESARDEWAKRYECEWPSDRCENCGDETGECGCGG